MNQSSQSTEQNCHGFELLFRVISLKNIEKRAQNRYFPNTEIKHIGGDGILYFDRLLSCLLSSIIRSVACGDGLRKAQIGVHSGSCSLLEWSSGLQRVPRFICEKKLPLSTSVLHFRQTAARRRSNVTAMFAFRLCNVCLGIVFIHSCGRVPYSSRLREYSDWHELLRRSI